MTVVRYINHELCSAGTLPPMEVENPLLIQLIRAVRLRALEAMEKNGNERSKR